MGGHVIVSVRFVRFDCVNFVLSSDTKLEDENFSAFWYDAVSRNYIGGWLSSIALKFGDKVDEGALLFQDKVNLPPHYLLHPLLAKISGIEVQAFSTVLHQNFQMLSALVTNEEDGATNDRTVVFDYGLSGTELHLSAEKFRWALGFSRVLYPKDCFFTGNITIDFGEPRQMDGCLILGLPATKMPNITPPIVRQKA